MNTHFSQVTATFKSIAPDILHTLRDGEGGEVDTTTESIFSYTLYTPRDKDRGEAIAVTEGIVPYTLHTHCDDDGNNPTSCKSIVSYGIFLSLKVLRQYNIATTSDITY